MCDTSSYSEESPAVLAHLQLVQAIVQRMAANSALCKGWCVTLVSAILIVVADKGEPDYASIAGIPTLLFFVLDACYLGLERATRESYNKFVRKVHDKSVTTSDFFIVEPEGSRLAQTIRSLGSFSVWPFYLTLGAMILLAMRAFFWP